MAETTQTDILLNIHTNTAEATTGIEGLKKGLQEVNNTEIDKPFQSFRTQIREAVNETKRMAEQFGTNSMEFANAAKHAEKLKFEFQEMNKTIAAFNPANKMQAFAAAGASSVHVMEGWYGAMAVMNIQSEKAEETIKRLQGLMALSRGLEGITHAQAAFKNMNLVIQSSTTFQKANTAATAVAAYVMEGLGVSTDVTTLSFKLLKGAIIATGIGALVVGLVMLVQNFDKIKETILNLVPGLGTVFSWIGKIVNSMTDFVGITTEAGREMDELAEKSKKRLKGEEDYLDLNAYKYDEYTQKKFKAQIEYDKKVGEIQERKDLNDKQKLELTKQYQEKRNHEIIEADKERQEAKEKQDEEAEKKAEALRKKEEERDKKHQEALQRYRENYQKHLETLQSIIDEADKKKFDASASERQKEITNIKYNDLVKSKQIEKAFNEELTNLNKSLHDKLISNQEYQDKLKELESKRKQASNALKEETNNEEIAVEVKYHKKILEAVESVNETAYQKEQQGIEKKFDDLLKNAKTKWDVIMLEGAKIKELSDSTNKHDAQVNVTRKETNLITTETKNEPNKEDNVETAKQKITNIENAKLEAEQAAFQLKLLQDKNDNDLLAKDKAEHESKITKIAKDGSESRKSIDKAEADAKKKLVNEVSNVMGTASELLGKQTAAGKALAIAQTTIKTIQGGVAAFTGMIDEIPGPVGIALGAVAAAGVVASGFKSVQEIINVPVPNSGGVSSPTMPSAPVINAQSTTKSQTQDVRVTNTDDKEPIKAYITNSDLQNNEQRNNFLNRASTF